MEVPYNLPWKLKKSQALLKWWKTWYGHRGILPLSYKMPNQNSPHFCSQAYADTATASQKMEIRKIKNNQEIKNNTETQGLQLVHYILRTCREAGLSSIKCRAVEALRCLCYISTTTMRKYSCIAQSGQSCGVQKWPRNVSSEVGLLPVTFTDFHYHKIIKFYC